MRRAETAAPPWSALAASGWRPGLSDVHAGFAGRRSGPAAGPERWPDAPGQRRSAVVVLLFEDELGGHVVLIERSHSSGTHRGHIAFPGGVVRDGEAAWAAALREAREEIGVDPAGVEMIASLDVMPTRTGFLIWPFIGALAGRPRFLVDRREVERVFTVPLAELVRPGAHWWEPWGPEDTPLPFFTVGDAVGWGATAALLAEVLAAAARGFGRRHS